MIDQISKEEKARCDFEKWAEPRGYSLERTTDSYKSQGTKSAWRGWWACVRFGLLQSIPSFDSLEVLDWTRDGMIDGTEFVRLDDVSEIITTDRRVASELRNAILEEAAKACENEAVEDTGTDGDTGYNNAVKHSAAAIRALKS